MKPISKTAFYCCGIRMVDAESPQSVCGDIYAKRFMNEDGLRVIESFKNETKGNASNVARHRIIDDILRQSLKENPKTSVVIIGCGFDSRAYRLTGGIWFELDEPEVIAYKNERLPVSECRNALRRIAIDFSADSLRQKLAGLGIGPPVIVVIEGVFVYLTEAQINQLLHTLRAVW